MNREKFFEKLESFNDGKHMKSADVFYLLVYFVKRKVHRRYSNFLSNLFLFNKLVRNKYNSMYKNSLWLNCLYGEIKIFFENVEKEMGLRVEIKEKNNVMRGADIIVNITDELYFLIKVYVTGAKFYFNIELYYDNIKNIKGYNKKIELKFANFGEFFAVSSLVDYVKKNIYDITSDERIKHMLVKDIALDIATKQAERSVKEEEEIPF
ncbi:hypothetical protein [Caminibacter pacificus]|uniref:Uncharacterized protein n=1 Tax=Caminibacter pacificus TaxID=1424653 RepID=A0AAJ4RE26_9BACT|nr:hypothetical protein [Caminibacter pacificus]QCI28342.1 hypothetical protein C6V80_05035 [Caminibacter pacificus]ROR40938.1 hypothetical protein EDC58_0420 [Caminibacter pacificus]